MVSKTIKSGLYGGLVGVLILVSPMFPYGDSAARAMWILFLTYPVCSWIMHLLANLPPFWASFWGTTFIFSFLILEFFALGIIAAKLPSWLRKLFFIPNGSP
jgi:hypothetical protein